MHRSRSRTAKPIPNRLEDDSHGSRRPVQLYSYGMGPAELVHRATQKQRARITHPRKRR